MLQYVCSSRSFPRPVLITFSHSLVGTDVRKAVFDGYPAANVVACDLHERYITLGHKLYNDSESSGITFFAADIFDFSVQADAQVAEVLEATQDSGPSSPSRLERFRGRVTHIYAGLLFHLFDEDTQFQVALRLAQLSQRKAGVIIFGRHEGKEEPGLISDDPQRSVSAFINMFFVFFTTIYCAVMVVIII